MKEIYTMNIFFQKIIIYSINLYHEFLFGKFQIFILYKLFEGIIYCILFQYNYYYTYKIIDIISNKYFYTHDITSVTIILIMLGIIIIVVILLI